LPPATRDLIAQSLRGHSFVPTDQVELAEATDARGVPLHLELLRGNRGDTTTLQGLLATLRRRFGIKEAVFVLDGGMSSKVNLEAVHRLGLKYVTRLVNKGALAYRQDGRAYLYRPLVTQAACQAAASESFIERVFGGSLKPMLAHFVERRKLTAAEMRELRRLLEPKED
jgi:hypothetical protein